MKIIQSSLNKFIAAASPGKIFRKEKFLQKILIPARGGTAKSIVKSIARKPGKQQLQKSFPNSTISGNKIVHTG